MNLSSLANNSRITLLVLLVASIVGWGCTGSGAIPVTIYTVHDRTAHKKYLPAAKENDAIAQLQLALAYRFGTAGADKDPAQAWQWLNRAASNGLLEAQLMLGDALISGSWGQPKDIDAGLQMLRTAAQGERRDVQEHLGMTLLDLGQDYATEAAWWFSKAAGACNRHAAMQLGLLYQRGLGVPQYRPLAHAWFTAADASINLQLLERDMSADELNRAQHQAVPVCKESAQ
jgi:TPR repeat protein